MWKKNGDDEVISVASQKISWTIRLRATNGTWFRHEKMNKKNVADGFYFTRQKTNQMKSFQWAFERIKTEGKATSEWQPQIIFLYAIRLISCFPSNAWKISFQLLRAPSVEICVRQKKKKKPHLHKSFLVISTRMTTLSAALRNFDSAWKIGSELLLRKTNAPHVWRARSNSSPDSF